MTSLVPCSTTSPSGEEPLVVPHHQLAVDLLHRLEGDPDGDKDGRAPEGEALDSVDGECDLRHQGDRREEDRPRQGDPVEDRAQVALRRWSGPDAWDVATLLADDVGL